MDKQITSQQNRAMHKLFSDISKECIDKGIDMREIVRDEVPIQCTPENIKWMWKLLQKALFGKRSTTELKKTGDVIVEVLRKNIFEQHIV